MIQLTALAGLILASVLQVIGMNAVGLQAWFTVISGTLIGLVSCAVGYVDSRKGW